MGNFPAMMGKSVALTKESGEEKSLQKMYEDGELGGGGQDFQWAEIPDASEEFAGRVVQFVGESTEDYIYGRFYACVPVEDTYSWKEVQMNDKTEPVLERDIESSVTIGGINEGDVLNNGTALTQLFSKLLEKYIAPSISISISPNKTLYEKGTSVDTITVTATVTKKSEPIEKVEFLVGGTVKETKTEGVFGGGSFSWIYNEGFSENTKFTVRTNDVDTQTSKSADTTVNFVLPYYYGVVDEATVSSLTGLTKDLSTKGTKTYAYTADNKFVVMMYDSSYADLESIKDQNNFENKNDFTKSVITIGDYSYKCYVSTGRKTISNFKYTFV